MRKLILYILLIIIMPVAMVLFSGNTVLRVSETYTYHFNDSQVIEYMGSDVTGSEFAKAITHYFNIPSNEEFQVYEENGEFRDPIFDEMESNVMTKAKRLMTMAMFFSIVLLGLGISIYIYLTGFAEREQLRIVGFLAIAVSVIAVVLKDFLLRGKAFRAMLYNRFIGINLSSSSALRILLGSPFEKTYIIFSTILAIILICVFVYIHHIVTKEQRLFS